MKNSLMICSALLFSLGSTGMASAQQGDYRAFDDVEAMLDEAPSLLGTKVSVAGEVEFRIDQQSFVLESGGLINDEVVVVVPKDLPSDQVPLIVDDARLMVKGTLAALSIIEIERELDWDWTPEIEAELNNVKVILLADDIKNTN